MVWWRRHITALTWLAIGVILIASAGLRLLWIDRIPPGYTFDESAAGVLATQVLTGVQRPIFFADFLGQEPLYIYASAGVMALLGGDQGVLPMHLTSIAFGMLTVFLTFLLGRELFTARVGLFAAAGIGASFWQVMLSRGAYRSISQVCLEGLSLYLLAVAWRRGALGWYLLAGAAVGGTVYTYLGARGFPAVFLVVGVWLVTNHGRPSRLALRRAGVFAFGTLAVLAPLIRFFLYNPSLFTMRTDQVFIFRDAVSHGHPWQLLLQNLQKILASFTFVGEFFWRYSLPGRPIFVGPVALAFYVGLIALAAGVWRREDRYALVAIALITMFVPAVLSWDAGAYTLRSMGLVPALFLLPALGLDWFWQFLSGRARWTAIAASGMVALILLADGALTARDYFEVWAPSYGAWYEGGADSVAQAQFLAQNAHASNEDLFVADNLYHNPAISQLDRRDYESLRWFDGRQDVVFSPSTRRPALYVIGFSAMPANVTDIFPNGDLVGIEYFASGLDGGLPPPLFRAYRLSADDVNAQVRRLASDPRLQPVEGTIANAVVPIGARIDGPVRAGNDLHATMLWRVQQPLPSGDYQLVVQLVDQKWNVIGTVEGLGFLTEQWHSGDIVSSDFSIPIPTSAPAMLGKVQLALYDTHTGQRLPVASGLAGIQALILGEARVVAASLPPSPDTRLDARLGSDITLMGAAPATFPSPSAVDITLDWTANRPLKDDYTVFVQVIGPDGKLVAQSDSWPAGGNLPTTSWLAGEIIQDTHHLSLPSAYVPGTYRLIAGMYQLSNGQRLAVGSGGDYVEVQRLSLPPSSASGPG